MSIKRYIVYIVISILTIIISLVIILLLHPLRKSENRIKTDILRLTPMGASMEDVLRVIESNGEWKIMFISYEHGFSRPGQPDPADIALGRNTIIGNKSIRVNIGEYRNIFMRTVDVFWGFDEEGKLIDVYVWKVYDAL